MIDICDEIFQETNKLYQVYQDKKLQEIGQNLNTDEEKKVLDEIIKYSNDPLKNAEPVDKNHLQDDLNVIRFENLFSPFTGERIKLSPTKNDKNRVKEEEPEPPRSRHYKGACQHEHSSTQFDTLVKKFNKQMSQNKEVSFGLETRVTGGQKIPMKRR